MRETIGNMWDQGADAYVITTNGIVNARGECVMGRGCAREAKDRYPGIAKYIGNAISQQGNVPLVVTWTPTPLITLPVKHHWREQADIGLIVTSVVLMTELIAANYGEWQNIVMPQPGCGNGRLEWENVQTYIEPLLDDRFLVCSYR